jgi:hypothetical protein
LIATPGRNGQRATSGLTGLALGLLVMGRACPASQVAERLGYGLVTVAGPILVDHRGARARVPEPSHEFLDRRGRSGGEVPPVCRRS